MGEDGEKEGNGGVSPLLPSPTPSTVRTRVLAGHRRNGSTLARPHGAGHDRSHHHQNPKSPAQGPSPCGPPHQ